MNMKVHQTLVWLNLLSFRTKDLAAPTIGIQSGLSRVGYRTPGCVQVLVSGAEDLATTACSTFPYTISCKSLHLPQNVHQQQTGLLRHFVSNTQACPLSSCNWALSCNQLQITTHCSVILTLSHQRTHCPSCNCVRVWELRRPEDQCCQVPKKFPASTSKKFGQFRKKLGQFPKTSISQCLVQLQCLLKIKFNFVLVYIIRGYHS